MRLEVKVNLQYTATSIRMTEDRDKWRKYDHGVATLGSRTAEEQNRTEHCYVAGLQAVAAGRGGAKRGSNVPKIVLNNTINLFFLHSNEQFGNFKP